MSKKCAPEAFMPQPLPRAELSDTPIKLCNEISRIFRCKMRESGDGEGVMSQQGARLVLALLVISDGRSQRELAEITHLRPPTVSIILKRMADEGMVEIKSSEKDMRVKYVYLTEYGREADRQNIEKIKAVDADGLRGLTAEEVETLMHLLCKIRDNLLEEKK